MTEKKPATVRTPEPAKPEPVQDAAPGGDDPATDPARDERSPGGEGISGGFPEGGRTAEERKDSPETEASDTRKDKTDDRA